MKTNRKFLRSDGLVKYLITITISVIFINIVSTLLNNPSWQIERMFDIRREANFSAWFSSMLLAIAAYYAYKCSTLIQTIKSGKRMWQLLSLGLLGMSCDEVAMIHEHLGELANKYFFKFDGIKHSSWVAIFGLPILLIIIVFILKFKQYLKDSNKAIKFLAIGASIYVFGAFFLESTLNFINYSKLAWLGKVENILEESSEMFGMIIIIMGLIEHRKYLSTQNRDALLT